MKIVLTDETAYGYALDSTSATGNGKWQCLLARALTKAGWSVVVGVREQLSPGQEESVGGIRFVGMEKGSLIKAWSKLLTKERPDWWYWQGSDPLWGAMLLVAKAKGVRGIFSTSFDSDVLPRQALTRRQRWWPLYAWGLRSVERIFVQHSGQMSALNQRLRAKTEIVPGLVPLSEVVKSRAQRGNYVAWVAVIRQPKRPDLLIEMARKTPDLRYIVCGGTTKHRSPAGYGERFVEELKSLPNVDYLGQVPPAKAQEIIANAAVLLCTSDQEGFPNTFLESWSAGTPVVSLMIDPGGVIRERGLGMVSDTVERAIADVRSLVNSSETFESVSTRARTYIEEVHSDAAVIKVFNKSIQGAA